VESIFNNKEMKAEKEDYIGRGSGRERKEKREEQRGEYVQSTFYTCMKMS
jgi:hypothetical protein